MRLLGIDTSTPGCSVALLTDNSIQSQATANSTAPEPNPTLKLVDVVLSDAGLKLGEVDGFAVTTGPGSFTGLRIGLSLIKGFVLATEKPFVGVGTLQAMAMTVEDQKLPVCPMLDARKGEVYCGKYIIENNEPVAQINDKATAPEEIKDWVDSPTLFFGSGWDRYQDQIAQVLLHPALKPEFKNGMTVAAGAALLAARNFENAHSYDLNTLTINYNRKSEAEINLKA